ncbi:hypothetical protein NBH00_21555 [Paraconexibacter antarcticus]|uniref:DUF4468 domain-containing protein n=1 Tax=Paraconexibacter antarcticus TaxID=2949664 RepID=A0ABY5DSI9_9ACTN|nr:hypothetical protein [Paraconexibacter antarcticus]UTI63916.1 hypothetical protein NBH00_21555 [Paraconexibacter antarcticus]
MFVDLTHSLERKWTPSAPFPPAAGYSALETGSRPRRLGENRKAADAAPRRGHTDNIRPASRAPEGRIADTTRVRHLCIAPFLAAFCISGLTAVASADGPFEPNETALMIAAPLTAPRVDASLETPQDEDWYLLQPQGVRQVGIIAGLIAGCDKSYGSVTFDLLDPDGGGSLPFASMKVGYSYATPDAPVTIDTASFTSDVGRRYYLHVTQSGCPGARYSFAIAPAGVLGTRLAPTEQCSAARKHAANARVKLKRYQAARKKAQGSRRRELGDKIQLQSQQVAKSAAQAVTTCARRALTGYPWE